VGVKDGVIYPIDSRRIGDPDRVMDHCCRLDVVHVCTAKKSE
jgi:hypothetical protein